MDDVATRSTAPETLDLGPLTASLGFLLRMAQLQNFEVFYKELGGYGLRPGEFSVLSIIDRNPGVRQGVLARRLLIKRAHMTKLIRALETRGFVKRTIPDDDRRAVELTLAPEGRAFVARHSDVFFGFATAGASRLSRGEERQLIRLLRKFAGIGEGSTP